MLPLLPQLISALAEKVCNKLIAMDPSAPARLTRLQGRSLAFRLKEWPASLVLMAADGQIVFNQHEDDVDCRIQTDLASLRLLRDPSQLTRLIKADALQIDGDIQLAQQYSYFFQQLSPDWQQSLSGYVGDAMAHKLALTLSQLQRYLSSRIKALEQTSVELAQDELKLTPTAAEMMQFSDAVSQLIARVEILQQRISAIQES